MLGYQSTESASNLMTFTELLDCSPASRWVIVELAEGCWKSLAFYNAISVALV